MTKIILLASVAALAASGESSNAAGGGILKTNTSAAPEAGKSQTPVLDAAVITAAAEGENQSTSALEGPAPEQPIRRFSERMEAPIVDEDDDDDDGFQRPFAAFKHRNVRTFEIGKFRFHNHILAVYSEADHDEFMDLWRGLTPQDKTNIVRYNWEAAMSVEQAIAEPVTRGSLSTAGIKDTKKQ